MNSLAHTSSIRQAPHQLKFASSEKPERESILILSDDHPQTVSVWTSQPALTRKLLRDHPEALVEIRRDATGKVTGVSFDLPAECLKFRRGKRKLSDRQRSALERARAASTSVTSAPKALRPQDFEGFETVKRTPGRSGPSPRLAADGVAVR